MDGGVWLNIQGQIQTQDSTNCLWDKWTKQAITSPWISQKSCFKLGVIVHEHLNLYPVPFFSLVILACEIAPDYIFGVTGIHLYKHFLSVCIFCFLFVPSVIGADAGNGIRVFIPDIGMFMASLAIWLLCRSLVQKRPPEDMAQYNADFVAEEQVGFICRDMQCPESSVWLLLLSICRFFCLCPTICQSFHPSY